MDQSKRIQPWEEEYTGFLSGDPSIVKIINYPNFRIAEKLPRIILNSLLDLPDASYDIDGKNCRNDLIRLLYYDEQNPFLEKLPLPTAQERIDLIFDGAKQDKPPSKKGYRIYQQRQTFLPQQQMQTQLRLHVDRVFAYNKNNVFCGDIYIDFIIITGYNYESITGGKSRTLGIALDIIEALNGCHIGGIGAIRFLEAIDQISDGQYNTGYVLKCVVEIGVDQ